VVAVEGFLGRVPLFDGCLPDLQPSVEAHREAVIAVVVVVRILHGEVIGLLAEQLAREPLLTANSNSPPAVPLELLRTTY